jgi:predicted Zn-dependent protease
MLTQPEARRLQDRVLTLVRATKGAEAIVALRSSRQGNTRFALNEISTSGDVERISVDLTVQFGQRSASATTNQLDDRSIDDLVSRVVRMARIAPENPEQLPVLGRQTYVASKAAIDAGTAKLAPDVRAKAIGAAIAAGDAAKVQIAGFFTHGTESQALATSGGLFAYHQWTRCSFSCTARTSDGTGSGWAGSGSNRFADLDAAGLAKIAVDKATTSAKPRKLDPGRYTVILEPAAVASLLQFLVFSLDARRADEGRSFFSKNPPGKKLFPETITLRADPTDVALTASPFDDDGLPLAATKWIDRGTLTGLVYNRFWAKKQGKRPTGRPEGWTLDGGSATREELIKNVSRGVLITRFWYLRTLDPASLLATGLTRDGVYLIENGAVTHPVNNFRFNESPVQMLAKCDGLGPTAIPGGGGGGQGGNTRVPWLRSHDFNLASISEAV